MSRRPSARADPSDGVFAQRRGEIPYQIYFEIRVKQRLSEGKRALAPFLAKTPPCVLHPRKRKESRENGGRNEVALVHSVMSGKKKTFFNGELINEAQQVAKEWSHAWSFGAHLMRVGINFDEYGLVIDGIPFKRFARRDPYLAAQLEATKRDSMRSLKTDEERRFEKMGYAGGRGNGRSRTVERKRPSGGSTGSAGSTGSRRGSSKDASRRRSGSEDRRNGKMRSSPPARSASTRNFKSPPNPSGPGDQLGRSKSSKALIRGSSNGETKAAKDSSGDILSADPSTLEVNPFNALVSEADFDPLGAKHNEAKGTANGAGNHPGGAASGGWPGAGGGGIARSEKQDAEAVLQLGMQLKTMGVGQQFQRQPQQQQYQQSSFDYTAYQQYDDSGFPQPVQQQQQQLTYLPASSQALETDPFGIAAQGPPQSFGAPMGDAGAGARTSFSDHYHARGQQQQQQQRAGGRGMPNRGGRADDAEDGKGSLDPWDVARGGMVNIDDITDTKHLPPVEVKPFTNDHRPLADLRRETPAKSKASVMMERPKPTPTHMAVAIVPYQAPGQQQPVPVQPGFPQPQNGNPFAHLALTQYGQPAQPILYTKSNDPFHNL